MGDVNDMAREKDQPPTRVGEETLDYNAPPRGLKSYRHRGKVTVVVVFVDVMLCRCCCCCLWFCCCVDLDIVAVICVVIAGQKAEQQSEHNYTPTHLPIARP